MLIHIIFQAYRLATEEEKSGNIFDRPRLGHEEELIQDSDQHRVAPLLVRVQAAAQGLSQAEEQVFALKLKHTQKNILLVFRQTFC